MHVSRAGIFVRLEVPMEPVRPLRDDETGCNQNTQRPKDSMIPTIDT